MIENSILRLLVFHMISSIIIIADDEWCFIVNFELVSSFGSLLGWNEGRLVQHLLLELLCMFMINSFLLQY